LSDITASGGFIPSEAKWAIARPNTAAALVANAGDRVAGALEARQTGDIDMQQRAGARPLIARR